ncbi:cryptochrome/deoxyribodipyrimidine photo-lyase family protein [Methyloradius palustris]|uniref:Deoxyribodipyrimidine photo-lyase n=1 Tax=Methyloradius palustris TaxID=2778876 RepID=A0A8D5JXK5_9PROT|nr:FAD-binding domain-containing protein [Methyloradius palustris]BCM23847.1 deoxyribodipyrimidine photo-lyase [Methyloradius palustris]
MTAPVQIVWFKRDLRVTDHAPLAQACLAGPVLPIFAWEPTVWVGDDYVAQHQAFARECLQELRQQLATLGLTLIEWPLGIIDALQDIRQRQQIAGLWSHEETGNGATFDIDRLVASWCKAHQVNWHEIPQHGVVRRLKNRNVWNANWERQMQQAVAMLPTNINAGPVIQISQIGQPIAAGTDKPNRQHGGTVAASKLFEGFLQGRAANYRRGMSSPLTATKNCSRLSPYLAWGVLSMREVVQATRARRVELKEMNDPETKGLAAGLVGFESRLHWHCHFIQKLESEPEMEFQHLHPAYAGLRDEAMADVESQRRLQAWVSGETGWPLVDACMAMLRKTGWLNFRMRAMLMSTASYLLWLHWREPGLHLAREFLDYEPGIHWTQTQMQSGTTGINTLRMYNPIKQAMDQDPTGRFVRQWLPQLANVPDTWIFQPWLMPPALQLKTGCVIDRDYPSPVVDIETAMREARARLSVVRRSPEAQSQIKQIVKKHASRKGMPGSTRDAKGKEQTKKKTKTPQLSLF